MNIEETIDYLNVIEEHIKTLKFRHKLYPKNVYVVKSGVEKLNLLIKDLNYKTFGD